MRALVLSGGGSKGGFQFSALNYIIKELGVRYDILCGISVGALNCAHLSMYSKDKQDLAIDNLGKVWNTISTPQVRKNWFPFGQLTGLWKESIYNSQPLADLVHRNLDLEIIRKSGVKVIVGTVSVTNGNYKCFTQDDDNFIEAVLASSSYPVGLNPVTIDGEEFTDGGLKHVIPIQAAIDSGADDIDIIMCQPATDSSVYTKHLGVIGFSERCLDIMINQIIDADVKLTQLYNRLVNAGLESNKRFINIKIIRPNKNLECSSLNFDQNEIQKTIIQGYQDAKDQYNNQI